MKNPMIKTLSLISMLLAVLLTSACGGGATSAQQPNDANTPPRPGSGDAAIQYKGPNPVDRDVQAFKTYIWDNLTTDSRCGSCHNEESAGQSSERMFMRRDDINLAYQTILPFVDREAPALSVLVRKVREQGHFPWASLESNAEATANSIESLIQRWASETGASTNTVVLTAPAEVQMRNAKRFPASAAEGGENSFAETVYRLVRDADSANCSACHSETSTQRQQPFFASNNVETAYLAARTLIDLNAPSNSRLVQRMRENHNVWADSNPESVLSPSAYSTQEMLAAVSQFANAIQVVEVNSELKISAATDLTNGVPASSGGRIETNVIALYEFKEGEGGVAFDSSGVDPLLNLNLSPGVSWVGSWGIRIADNGKAQGNTIASKKLYNAIRLTGEYSIETWVVPANVTQEDSRIVTYSGSTNERNFSLHQTLYDYDFLSRTENTNINGSPMLSTPSADELLQATLQHVVVSYNPFDGRRIYVNGELVAQDTLGGNLNDWDDSYVLAVGNEVDNARGWDGTVRLLAIHNRALSLEQVRTNFEAGVGQKYYLMFGVSDLVGMSEAYVVFSVEVFDDYSYLFADPFFISLDREAVPTEAINIRGIRIGINGKEAAISQAFANVNVTVTADNYEPGVGTRLSTNPRGTLVAVEGGAMQDFFFLSFDQIGDQIYPRLGDPEPERHDLTPVATQPDFGLRLFDEIFQNMSAITTVPSERVYDFYVRDIRRSLPASESPAGFLASQQSAIAQLALAYCKRLIGDDTLRTAYFGNYGDLSQPEQRDALINPLLNRMLIVADTNLFASHPDAASIKPELLDLLATGLPNNSTENKAIAVCTTVLASAAALIQ